MKNEKINLGNLNNERSAIAIGVAMASLLLSGCGDTTEKPREYYEAFYSGEDGCLEGTSYDIDSGAKVFSMLPERNEVTHLSVWAVEDSLLRGEPSRLWLEVHYDNDVISLAPGNDTTARLWESRGC